MNPEIPKIETNSTNLPTDSVQAVSNPQSTRAGVGDDMRQAIAAGDVLGSARTREGTPLNLSEITPDAIVTVNVDGKRMEMRVSDAERFGFIAKTGSDYSATKNQPANVEAQPTEPQADQPELFSTEREAAYVQLTSDVPSTLQARMNKEWIHGGDISEETLREVASAIPGADPDMIRERVKRTVDLFSDQACASIRAQGLNPDQVIPWAEQNHAKTWNQAVETQVTSRSTKGYQKVAALYLESLDTINPKGLLSMKMPEGVTIRKSLNGKILVDAYGGSMSWAQAVRHGVVKFKGHK